MADQDPNPQKPANPREAGKSSADGDTQDDTPGDAKTDAAKPITLPAEK